MQGFCCLCGKKVMDEKMEGIGRITCVHCMGIVQDINNIGSSNEAPGALKDDMVTAVVYYSPADYPGKYIAREYTINNKLVAGPVLFIEDDITTIRNKLRQRFCNFFPRHESDATSIVETWI